MWEVMATSAYGWWSQELMGLGHCRPSHKVVDCPSLEGAGVPVPMGSGPQPYALTLPWLVVTVVMGCSRSGHGWWSPQTWAQAHGLP